jgi:hypothetical protein
MSDQAATFGRLVWQPDRMLLDDLVFRLEHYKDDSWELGDECFRFYKIKPLVDQYAEFWSLRKSFVPENLFELGIWDGGSVAFWSEVLHPRKHVAIDRADREDSWYFARYKENHGREASINTYWRTDQVDKERLQEIVEREFDGPLDVVIDDCSHLYAPTRASFEAVFPFLRPGGLYVIEDWAWSHWDEFQASAHEWVNETPLTSLVFELVEAAGTSAAAIASLTVYEGFAVVERGAAEIASQSFNLDDHIIRRPQDSGLAGPFTSLRRRLSRAR